MIRIRNVLALAATCGLVGLAPGALAQSAGVAVASAPSLSANEAAQRFEQAESFERRRDLRSAFDAYTQAGEAGNGLAQKKLGDIYSTGSPFVERDYETALKWYEKARDQGIEIPKPLIYPGEQNQVIRLK